MKSHGRFAALASCVLACAASMGACSPPPPTALVLRIDSNMTASTELVSYDVSVRRTGESEAWFQNTYALAMPANRLPATLAIIPRNVDDRRAVEVVLTGRVSNQPTVVQRARVGIRYGHVAVLDMFLARECIDAEAQRRCGDPMRQTCTRGGMCVAIDQQAPLPDYDASVRDASEAGIDAVTPADVVDAAVDVSTDQGFDASIDTGTDVATDTGFDAPPDIATVDAVVDTGADTGPMMVAGIGAPRPLAPLSTSRVHTNVPTLRWSNAGIAATGAFVEACRDRAMTTSCIAPVTVAGAQGSVGPLGDGTWFWRLRGTNAGNQSIETSPVWQFVVHRAPTPRDASDGNVLDLNGDGLADLAIGAPFDADGRVHVYYGRAASVFGPAASVRLDSPAASALFGIATASAGDVNGDGFGDLAVGASNANSVYVYFGSATGIGSTPNETIPPVTGSASFGQTTSAAGDTNADGYADIVVAGPNGWYLFEGGSSGLGMTTTRMGGTATGVTDATSAGDLDGDRREEFAIGEATANTVTIFYGNRTTPAQVITGPNGGALGYKLSGVGDINGDGLADLVASDATGPFRAMILTGVSGQLQTAATLTLADAPQSLSLGGDFDADGFDDLIVGLPFARTNDGSAQIYFGAAAVSTLPGSSPLVCNATESGSASFGQTVHWVGDSDGDGHDDLAIALDGLTFRRVYAFNGASRPRTVCPTRTPLDSTSQSFGFTIARAPRRRSTLPALLTATLLPR